MWACCRSGTGQIAISYLANPDGSSLLDGWLSETDDALAPSPLWWAAPLNDPTAPLINSTDPTSFGNRLFVATDTFAPDGDPWAAFQCANTVACPGARMGVVGHLAPQPSRRGRWNVGRTTASARARADSEGLTPRGAQPGSEPRRSALRRSLWGA